MISDSKLDLTKEGVSAITVTKDDVSCDVPVYVYEVTKVDALAPDKVVSWGDFLDLWFTDVIDGNESALVETIDFRQKPEYGIDNTIATLRDPATGAGASYELYTIGQVSEKQCILAFNNYKATEPEKFPVGGVLTLNENFRFYRYVDETWIASYKFDGPVSYVWDGAAWQNYVADARRFRTCENRTRRAQGRVVLARRKTAAGGLLCNIVDDFFRCRYRGGRGRQTGREKRGQCGDHFETRR